MAVHRLILAGGSSSTKRPILRIVADLMHRSPADAHDHTSDGDRDVDSRMGRLPSSRSVTRGLSPGDIAGLVRATVRQRHADPILPWISRDPAIIGGDTRARRRASAVAEDIPADHLAHICVPDSAGPGQPRVGSPCRCRTCRAWPGVDRCSARRPDERAASAAATTIAPIAARLQSRPALEETHTGTRNVCDRVAPSRSRMSTVTAHAARASSLEGPHRG